MADLIANGTWNEGGTWRNAMAWTDTGSGGGTGGSDASIIPAERTATPTLLAVTGETDWRSPFDPSDRLPYQGVFANLLAGPTIASILSITLTAQASAIGLQVDGGARARLRQHPARTARQRLDRRGRGIRQRARHGVEY